MQVEETEFYRTRNGNVLGPFTHKPRIGWIVPGLRVSWDNDGRLRRSTIEEHPLDLMSPATIVLDTLAPLAERAIGMSDEEGHLFEAVDQLTSKGHGYIDLDNEIVVFTEKGFVEFAKNTFIIGDPMQRIQSGIEKLAYINKRQMQASVDLAVQPEHETLQYHKVLVSHDPMEAYRGRKVEVKMSATVDPQMERVGMKLDEVKMTEPPKVNEEYEEFVRKNLKQIASMFGLPYSVLAANMSRAASAMAEFKARGEELQKALAMLKPTSDYRLPAGPGVSRKGWPQIGTVWRHRNGNQYEVTGYSNKEGTKIDYPKTVHYRNISNGEDYSRRLDRWMASMTFKHYPIQLSARLLDSTGEIPKRVFFDTLQNAFYRFSAHKNRHYRMPAKFYDAWSKRSGEFPRAYANLTAKLGDVRLTFPSLQAKRDVRPEDSKFTMSLSFPGTVSREQVERIRKQVDDTVLRRRAEMTTVSIPEGVFYNRQNGRFMNLNGETMPMDFYQTWIGRNHLFPATYEAAWDSISGPAVVKEEPVNAALGEPYIPATDQMRSYMETGRWIDGKPLDTMKPGVRRFLEEIGTTNAIGDLVGVMQTNANKLTAQYKRAGKAGVICVEVELPKAITVDVAR